MGNSYRKVIGIDLGTTYSAVSVFDTDEDKDNAVIIRERDEGYETTPSVVSLDPRTNKVIVGWAAKANLKHDPENTIVEVKREMGELFRPETLTKFNAGRIFTTDDPVRVLFAGERRLPQEISAFILMKMKDIAEQEIGEEIRDAVVTVPAYFTEKQRKATEEAALLAGLYPRQLIPEPTAAAICYGFDRADEDRKTYLVYDLGGGTFDVSIIEVEGGVINVLATDGDSRLGGGDFDDAITTWAVHELMTKHGLDVRQDPSQLAKIKSNAEAIKIQLSLVGNAVLDLSFLDREKLPRLELSRETFERIITDPPPELENLGLTPLLGKSIDCVKGAIKQAEEKKGISREGIDSILLVGGSTKIPLVKTLLLEHFEKEDNFVRDEINPDTVVARGAATMAGRFEQSPPPFDIRKCKETGQLVNPEIEQELRVSLITEHTLGVGVQDDLVSPIIPQGRNIPAEGSDTYTNSGPTTDIQVVVYQGEGKYTYENTVIGTLHLGPIEPKPAHEHQFKVTFKLDANGLLNMMVDHINEGKTHQATFEQITGVGGDDALEVLRQQLVQMYSSTISPHPGEAAGTEPSPTHIPAPEPPPDGGSDVSGPAAPISEGAPVASPPEPPQESAPAAPRPPTPAPPHGRASQASGPASRDTAPQALPTALAEIAVDIPEQYKSTVRRARKQFDKTPDRELLECYNAFVTALNGGASEEDLEDPGDTLADAISDARNRPRPVEVEIPAQFKQIVRRARKQLDGQPNDALKAALEAFLQALTNDGARDDVLEDLGDSLADAYDDARGS